MKKNKIILMPMLVLSMLISGCNSSKFVEITDSTTRQEAISALNAATKYTDDYIDATFKMKVSASILTLNFTGVIQVTGFGTDQKEMKLTVSKTTGDTMVYKFYHDGTQTYHKMYDLTFVGQTVMNASQARTSGAVQLPSILTPESNYNFFDSLGINSSSVSSVKQKKDKTITTNLIPVSVEQLASVFGEAGGAIRQLPTLSSLYLGLTMNGDQKIVGMAFEAKTNYNNYDVTITMELTLKREGAPTIESPFTPEEIASYS
jgi:hypothetical protein